MAAETSPLPAQDAAIRPEDLTGVFAVRQWVRDLGMTAWLLVGITLLIAGVVWLLALTDAIVMPVLTAGIIAAVLSPVVRSMQRHRVPRAAAAGMLLVAALAVTVAMVVLILSGIASQSDALLGDLRAAADKLRSYLVDAGVSADAARSASDGASGTLSEAFHTLISGVGAGIGALASLAIFLSFTALSLFFLLKDGPAIRVWAERHMGVPRSLAHAITHRTLQALRGYFAGVTAVAVFNAVVIGLGALILGVPRAGSIAVVNFATAYVPYIGAWSAGAFTVLIALGAKGPEVAVAMGVITLLANGALQQMIQPIAFGATLNLHPLAVLVVTIGAGALFGAIGLILAAPLTAAATRVSADLAAARRPVEVHAVDSGNAAGDVSAVAVP